jgi:signal transduction histidine kinase
MDPSEEQADGNELIPMLWAQADHDLRQPLHALFYMTRTLGRSLPDPKQRETIQYMELALQGLQTKLDLLMDLSRIDSGSSVPTLTACSVHTMCEALSAALADIARAHGVHLRFCVSPGEVVSDQALLSLMIRSLILNALKLANRSNVLVGSRRRLGRIRLEVYFRATPLSEGQQRGAFVQLATTPATSELGLGLGFLAHLGRSLDHRIECRSLPGSGVCLALSLPAAGNAWAERERLVRD